MFTKSAKHYDAMYAFKDYSSASMELHGLVQRYNHGAKTLLDVGCGTGKHLEVLREHYQVEGLDISPDLLDIARARCPGVRFHHGDMVTFSLEQTYDVIICLFASIGYVKSVENMHGAVDNMARHLSGGGILLVEPWFSPENYWLNRVTANHVDEPELKITWMYTSQVKDRVSILDINYLVGTPKGIDYFVERQEMGLFTHDEYMQAFKKANLDVSHDPKGFFGRGLYIGMNGRSQRKGPTGTV